jgi:CBS domain-containing protein
MCTQVVGDGMDPRVTPVSAIMTPNPMVTRDTTSATEALQTMVTRGFRHLVRAVPKRSLWDTNH